MAAGHCWNGRLWIKTSLEEIVPFITKRKLLWSVFVLNQQRIKWLGMWKGRDGEKHHPFLLFHSALLSILSSFSAPFLASHLQLRLCWSSSLRARVRVNSKTEAPQRSLQLFFGKILWKKTECGVSIADEHRGVLSSYRSEPGISFETERKGEWMLV